MTTHNYAEFYKAALAAAGGPPSEVFPTGQYLCRIANVKPGGGEGKKFQVGVRFECIDPASPMNGKSTWINQTLSPENAVAFGIFLRFMLSLGVPQSALDAGVAPEELHSYIVVGTEGIADFKGDRWYPAKPDPKAKLRQDLSGFKILGTPAVAAGGGPAIPSGPAPTAPAPQPAILPMNPPVAQPVPAIQPVTVPVPVTPAAPAPVAAQPTIEELQAQIAAMQGQAPAAPVPAAPPAGAVAPSVPF